MRARGEALEFYKSVITEDFVSSLLSAKEIGHRAGIFHSSLVIWLMIAQRLRPGLSLSQTIDEMREGLIDPMVERAIGSIRARTGRISLSTGGYSQARARIPLSVIEEVFDRLSAEMNKPELEGEIKNLYVVDGSTVLVAHTGENIKEYGRHSNQHGKSHFPVVRIGVATNALSGVAIRPAIGAYTGANAVGENVLAEELLARLPERSVVIGDRYYGSYGFASAVISRGHDVIVRIKESRGKNLIAKVTPTIGEQDGVFSPSDYEKKLSSNLPEAAGVKGKFVWIPLKRKRYKPETLILFTTLDLPAERILKLYAMRWNVELDLRDIKSTLEMEFIDARTPDMVRKQIVLGVAAFNLIRRVIGLAAEHAKVPPRSLSFSMALHRMQSLGTTILSDRTEQQKTKSLLFCFTDWKPLMIQRRNKKRPPEPRKIWPHGRYPTFATNTSRDFERQQLLAQFQ